MDAKSGARDNLEAIAGQSCHRQVAFDATVRVDICV